MSHVIILARTTREGQTYAREHADELPRGRAIVPTSAAQINGVVPHLVIELPGFAERRDRHAVLAAVKRSTRKYLDCEWRTVGPSTCDRCDHEFHERWEACQAEVGYDHLNGSHECWCEGGAPLTERTLEVAFRYDRLREASLPWHYKVDPEVLAQEVAALDAAEAKAAAGDDLLEQRKRRRSRCKDCGALHFPTQSCVPDVSPDDFFGPVS